VNEKLHHKLDWADLLLADLSITPQYIIETKHGLWECRCGNTEHLEGFACCDGQGLIVERVLGPWDGRTNICLRCCSIINGDTLEILGIANQAIADKNDEYRWVELMPHQLD